MDILNSDPQIELSALLKILAMGNHEIEEGRFLDAEEIFAELDADDRRQLLQRD